MINYTNILIPRRTKEERTKNHIIAIQKQIQQYIKNGSKDYLDLSKSPITTLPNNLKNVGGYFNLSNTPITSLPDNLTVGGSLNLAYTSITSLPNNLNINGHINLENTPITSLPNNLNVNGYINLDNTPISKKYTAAQLKRMLPGITGNIYSNIYTL